MPYHIILYTVPYHIILSYCTLRYPTKVTKSFHIQNYARKTRVSSHRWLKLPLFIATEMKTVDAKGRIFLGGARRNAGRTTATPGQWCRRRNNRIRRHKAREDADARARFHFPSPRSSSIILFPRFVPLSNIWPPPRPTKTSVHCPCLLRKRTVRALVHPLHSPFISLSLCPLWSCVLFLSDVRNKRVVHSRESNLASLHRTHTRTRKRHFLILNRGRVRLGAGRQPSLLRHSHSVIHWAFLRAHLEVYCGVNVLYKRLDKRGPKCGAELFNLRRVRR